MKTDAHTLQPSPLQDEGNAVRRGLQCPGWAVAGAAMAGRSHLRSQTPCQDAFAIAATDSGFVAVLCDGAGSAVHSELGARDASRAVCDFLAENHEQDLDPRRIIACALEPITVLAAEMGAMSAEFACTLVAVKVTGDDAFLFHLGDGAIIASRAGEARVASRPARGEFANSTVFVTSDAAASQLRIRHFRLDHTTRSIVLTTDGLQDLLMNNSTGEASQVCEQIATWHDTDLPDVVAGKLDASLKDFFLPRTHDDCSMVIARRMTTADEVLPVVCPECARWVLTARRTGEEFSFRCQGCGCWFISNKFPRGGSLENVQTRTPGLNSVDALSAAAFLHDRGDCADRWSSLWVSRLSRSGAGKQTDPLGSTGALRHALGKSLSAWKTRRLDSPPALIIGKIRPGRRFPIGSIMVAVAIRKDGKRDVAGFDYADKPGGPRAFLRSLFERGATDPAVVVFHANPDLEMAIAEVWPGTTARGSARSKGNCPAREERGAFPFLPERLRSLAPIRSLEREVRALLKGIPPTCRDGAESLLEAALAYVSDRWMEGRAYVKPTELLPEEAP